jgi:hypothetical protein
MFVKSPGSLNWVWRLPSWIGAWSLIHNAKTKRHCHVTEKSDMCKEMPVIPVDGVVDPKRIIGKNGEPKSRRGTRGR